MLCGLDKYAYSYVNLICGLVIRLTYEKKTCFIKRYSGRVKGFHFYGIEGAEKPSGNQSGAHKKNTKTGQKKELFP